MKPNLTFLAGPLKGTVFELTGDEVSIGRDVTNLLTINDRSVSRQHCIIKQENGQFKITDLDSHNGTFVNDTPAKEQVLEHGDRIRVGDSLFLFLLREEEESQGSDDVGFDDGTILAVSTIRYRLEDVLYSMARDLSTLIETGTAINSIRSLKELQKRLLESLFEIVPAERGAILLLNESLDNPTSVFALERFPGASVSLKVSRTVAEQVMTEGVAILSNDIVDSDVFSKSESLIASKIHSLVCVPLTLHKKVTGIIYLDTTKPGGVFNESHLRLVTAIAGMASGALDNARHLEWLEAERQRLQEDFQIEHNMIGESKAMKDVYRFIARVAPTNSTILIHGESGTGKELAAHAIHRSSPRRERSFVAVNCSAIPETLLESELFGYDKGAFTGAFTQKKGRLEIADGGTLFLDEIGEMSPQLQTKLLRVIQSREFERVGGTRTLHIDIRILAATNKNLEEAIKTGAFRQDLYFRLNVVSVRMPALRERREDISLLAKHFTARYSEKCNRRVTGLTQEALECLTSYDWPGNVRELENAIERAIVLGSTDRIQPEDLPELLIERMSCTNQSSAKYYDQVKEAKRAIIQKSLQQSQGNYTEAARLLGIHPNNLHRLIRNLNLKESK
ncbi:MAG: sigma-54-dependent Fis family transcriptional regulator [Acidobacteria bacterium]|nr:MAG: sigma-54-dependent Fis family transcriptional regulator [Acidobacteriota bacterium]